MRGVMATGQAGAGAGGRQRGRQHLGVAQMAVGLCARPVQSGGVAQAQAQDREGAGSCGQGKALGVAAGHVV